MNGSDTLVRMYETHRETSLDHFYSEPLTSLLVCGIVNPFGPTLTAVVAAGELRSGATVPIIRVGLNPFTQGLHVVGELNVGRTWSPVFTIRSMFGLSFGSCPSLLLPSRYLTAEEAVSVHADFLRGFE